jgi:hypothetical protein
MIRGIKVEVRQNFEGNFYYQLLSDTVGVFSTFEDAEREGNSALSTVVEKFTSHNKPKPEIKPGICRGTGHGSCKGDTSCNSNNSCFSPA